MTRDEALAGALAALARLQAICAEYQDIETARIAADAVRALMQRQGSGSANAQEQQGIAPRPVGCKPRG